jgi:ferredoxin-type protein NapG
MREMLSPFAGIIERKIQPILSAIEAIPDHAERLTKMDPTRALDQMHTRIAKALPGPMPLPVRPPPPPPRRIDRFLRPPGAMEPGEYESVCSRCGKCVEACPAEAIKLDPNGLIAEGFPYIVPDDQPCVVSEELACMKSCPTGALKLVDRLDINLGTAKVDHALCLRDRGENCTLCLDVCPVMDENPALCALVASPLTGKIIVHKNICIGCGLCENRCPTEPRAITIIPHAPLVDPIIA